MSRRRVVIVGASLAGATTATTLRRLGFDGDVLLVGDELHLPYERPALSKAYLSGHVSREQLLVQPAAAYQELGIELRLGWTATGLDVERGVVTTAEGPQLAYDELVIATGSTNITPPIPGIDKRGVHQLRRLEDADWLSEHANSASSAVVVGMGFIGCEVAATLNQRGLAVTMVDRASGPMLVQLGAQLSETVARWHRDHGTRMITAAQVAEIEGDLTAERVRLTDGRRLNADLVVIGVGVTPATQWLADAPLHLVRGAVDVNPDGRTNIPHIYAAGDLTATCDPVTGTHRRNEHYRSAITQARRVAHAVAGAAAPAADPSWFWTEQYDHTLHWAGEQQDGDAVHTRQDPFSVFFTRQGRLSAVCTIDAGPEFRRALRLVGHRVDPAALIDPRTDLRRLMPV